MFLSGKGAALSEVQPLSIFHRRWTKKKPSRSFIIEIKAYLCPELEVGVSPIFVLLLKSFALKINLSNVSLNIYLTQ